jgi:hypothetical protein
MATKKKASKKKASKKKASKKKAAKKKAAKKKAAKKKAAKKKAAKKKASKKKAAKKKASKKKASKKKAASSVGIRPRSGMYSIFSAVTYKAWYALGEFVDNSLQSFVESSPRLKRAHKRKPHLEIAISVSEEEIRVRDNAGGITGKRFPTVFEPGRPHPDGLGLSVYGIGMKSAAAWFADSFTLTTSALGESVERSVRMHFPTIITEGLDEVPAQESAAEPLDHYTDLVLSDLRNPIHTQTHRKVRDHLGSIYRAFLRRSDVTMTYNGERLSYEMPAVLEAPDCRPRRPRRSRVWRKEIDLQLPTGERIHGFAALRQVGRAAGAGFALFRKDRVITGLDDSPWRPREIFGTGNTYKTQRLFGELHLEGVRVAYSKDGFIWAASEEEVIRRLRKILDSEPLPLLKQAERYRARKVDPATRKATRSAFKKATEAVERAAGVHLPTQSSQTLSDGPATSLAPSELTLEVRDFALAFLGKDWTVSIQLADDRDPPDWIEVADSLGTSEDGVREIGVRIYLNSPFMRRFARPNAVEIEPILRLGAGMALAQVAARVSGVRYASQIVRNLNELLAGELSEP